MLKVKIVESQAIFKKNWEQKQKQKQNPQNQLILPTTDGGVPNNLNNNYMIYEL